MQLHPFFSYFGSKYRLAKFYSAPKYNTVVEPFGGSAGYALKYWEKNVFIYEIYEPIVQVWDYLIKVSEKEILSLPIGTYDKENPIDKEKNIPEEAKKLIGFWLTESQTISSRYPLSKSRGGNWTERKKQLISSQLKYIRHWKVFQKSFEEIDNEEATWFVDPPYEKAGARYKFNKIDYKFLGDWCKTREGQVIVCEQDPATWLDFKTLKISHNGSNNQYKEVFWEK